MDSQRSKTVYFESASSRNSDSNTLASNDYVNQDKVKIESYTLENNETKLRNYKEDPCNPLNWPDRKKYLCLLAVSLNSFISYFSSAIYMPAVFDIMDYFKTNLTIINATIALYLVVNAIAPLFWAPLSECIGRRWVYIISLILCAACTVICGISTNMGLFFTFRLLQGVFACVGQAVGGGTISDIFDIRERGRAMGLFMLGTILGPSIAPVCGGYINQYLGWRWIFYIKAIICGVLLILSYFLIPETLYVPESQRVPPPGNFKERFKQLKFNPLDCLKLLLNLETALVCIPISIVFGWFYYIVTILSPTFLDIYEFTSSATGLCFLASGVGNVSGAIFSGIMSDKIFNYYTEKNGGVAVKEFRLKSVYIGMPFVVIGALMYGWLIYARVHFMGPLVAFAFFCFGFTVSIAGTNGYLVEANLSRAASAVSLNNFTRNMCGMIFSLTGIEIRAGLGDGWSYTLGALMCLASYLICLPLVEKKGERWRTEREKKLGQ